MFNLDEDIDLALRTASACQAIILVDLLERIQFERKVLYATKYLIENTAGEALGYPAYVDDQVNFPGATKDDGVCIGEHVTETIVAELADAYKYLQAQLRLSTQNGVVQ